MKKVRINERGGVARGGEYSAPLRDVERTWKSKFLAPFTEPFEHENDDINHKIGHRKRIKIKRPIDKFHDNVNEWVEITEDIISEDLAVWFGKKKKKKGSSQPKGPWVNICKKKKGGGHPPCGRGDADKGGYPVCRGAGVAGKMSQKDKDSACRRKRDKEKKDTQRGKGQKPTRIKVKNYKKESIDKNIVKNILKEYVEIKRLNETNVSTKNISPSIKNTFTQSLTEQKKDLISKIEDNDIDISSIQDLLSQLNDKDITGQFLRNLDRKLFKGGDKEKNVRDYIEKYIKSLSNREEMDPNDDFNVEDEFLYGGVEPEKSKIGKKTFKREVLPLQVELLKLQEDVKKTGKSIVVVFEGRDSAGKGSTIKKMVEYLDPKYFNVIALGLPTKEDKKDWFGRYEKQIEPGKINLFDRSWYNRGIVEPVMGYSSEEEYLDFMENVNGFEQSLIDRGVELVKFWLSITPETQKKRFEIRKSSPLKYWKFSPNDEKSIDKWDKYTEYKNRVMKQTKEAKPWTVVDTNDKRAGILNAFRHLLNVVDYEGKEVKNIGSVYPEVVTTIKEKEMNEGGNRHWTKDKEEVINKLTENILRRLS